MVRNNGAGERIAPVFWIYPARLFRRRFQGLVPRCRTYLDSLHADLAFMVCVRFARPYHFVSRLLLAILHAHGFADVELRKALDARAVTSDVESVGLLVE